MDLPMRLMDRIKARMEEDSVAFCRLRVEALRLNLRPQPWWNREFCEHAIQAREAELDAKRRVKNLVA